MSSDDVTMIPQGRPAAQGQSVWRPVAGPTTQQLLTRQTNLDDSAKSKLVASSVRTLGRCAPPAGHGTHASAHLVIGQVQSGKTMAFTTLMALAQDNGFRLIVVVAGTKTNLFNQTVARLKTDLFTGRRGLNPWRVFESHSAVSASQLASVLRDEHDPAGGTQTAVCFVLKNAKSLKGLGQVLRDIARTIDLERVPALVIDDEADQASPNLKARVGGESGVYEALGSLRSALPRHDMLLYTATPEAPLLIGRQDSLSPKTVTVLESGPAYIGGVDLFVEHREDYVRTIPDSELANALDPDAPSPPASLRRAIALFLLSIAVAESDDQVPWPLSMLIHPASGQSLHDTYLRWAQNICLDLRTRLADPRDSSYTDVLHGELSQAYADLSTTLATLPALEDLAAQIPALARQVEIRVVNQTDQRQIDSTDWQQHTGWILVGGIKLDRGFTVANLTTTYMPRGVGVGNADTLQQRARFYGYKRPYLGLCRGWFNSAAADGFAGYVEHEQVLQRLLSAVDANDESLATWRRTFLLEPGLRLTRRQVINRNIRRFPMRADNGWFWQRDLSDESMQDTNRALVQLLSERYEAKAIVESLDPRGRHTSVDISWNEVEQLIVEWATVRDDAERILGLQLALEEWGAARNESAHLVFLDGSSTAVGQPRRTRRPRQANGEFNIVQGSDDRTKYPGDAAIFDADRLTIQIHVLDLLTRDGAVDLNGAVAIGIHTPDALADLIIEAADAT